MSNHPLRDALWNWSRDNWAWLVTTAIAVYAAVLATDREVLSRRDKKLDVRVYLSTEMLMLDGNATTPYVGVRIENHGGVAVTFGESCCGLRAQGMTTALFMPNPYVNTKFPRVLLPGQSFTINAPKTPLFDVIRGKASEPYRLKATVMDEIRRQYDSEWMDLKQD